MLFSEIKSTGKLSNVLLERFIISKNAGYEFKIREPFTVKKLRQEADMGLDIYAGTLTRYYSGNWKTIAQQWGEANGYQVNVVRANKNEDEEPVPPEEILEAVTGWRDLMIERMGSNLEKKPLWNEDNDSTPYYTDKPDWNAIQALMLYTICKINGQEVPETVSKHYDLFEKKIYNDFIQKHPNISLINGDGWWLPFDDAFMFKYFLPTGQEQQFATVGLLKNELEQINSIEWNADETTILKWADEEGYPVEGTLGADKKVQFSEPVEDYNTVSLAKFAFSILWQAVKHSEKYGTVIIFDF